MPGPFPRVRITFVAPMLPLPTTRMSIPRAFAQRKPVGIEPRRYEAAAQPIQITAVMRVSVPETGGFAKPLRQGIPH